MSLALRAACRSPGKFDLYVKQMRTIKTLRNHKNSCIPIVSTNVPARIVCSATASATDQSNFCSSTIFIASQYHRTRTCAGRVEYNVGINIFLLF